MSSSATAKASANRGRGGGGGGGGAPPEQQQLQGEGQGRGSLHQHQGTQQDHPSTSRPSESSDGDVCGAVMCEECGGCGCCVLVLQTMPCSQHKTHCVNQHCISLYVLYSARNVFKTIIGCDCYPLLVLRLPNDFLEGCPLETKERLSTMTSLVHSDNVTQWLQTTRVLSYS